MTASTRVRITLLDVRCTDTEDITGADHFYLTGGVIAGGTTKPVLTRPIRIDDGETKVFAPDERVLLDMTLPVGDKVGLSLVAWDEDAAKDYERHQDDFRRLQSALKTIAAVDPSGIAAVVSVATGIVLAGMQVDDDDELGTIAEIVPVTSGTSTTDRAITISSSRQRDRNSLGYSSWKYTVRYRVECNPLVDRPLPKPKPGTERPDARTGRTVVR